MAGPEPPNPRDSDDEWEVDSGWDEAPPQGRLPSAAPPPRRRRMIELTVQGLGPLPSPPPPPPGDPVPRAVEVGSVPLPPPAPPRSHDEWPVPPRDAHDSLEDPTLHDVDAEERMRELADRAGELPASGAQRVLPLGRALAQRVALGSAAIPMWVLLGACVVGASLGIGVAAVLAGRSVPAPVAVPAPTASATLAPSASGEAPRLSVVERAAQGDEQAMQELSNRPLAERKVEEAVAVARGREQRRRAELADLEARLRAQPSLLDDAEIRTALLALVADPRTAIATLRVVAALDSPLGPDLLYEVWTGTRDRTEATVLAQELVYLPEVRGRASPALAVALDLRETEDCEVVSQILPRAVERGDKRSLRLLGRLLQQRGCGPNKTDDCFACLRAGDALVDAIQAVKDRPSPAL